MRKTAILTIGLACFTFVSNAQISKGSVYLGGSLGYYKNTDKRTNVPVAQPDGQSKNFNVSPAVGAAIRENLIGGIIINYGNSNSDGYDGTNYTSESKSLGAGLFVRKYVLLTKKFYAFFESSLGYNDSKYKRTDIGTNPYRSETNGWGIGLNFNPGLAYNITKSFYIEMSFADIFQARYAKSKQVSYPPFATTTPIVESSSFGISTQLENGFYPNVGVRFIIPKK